MTEKLLQYIWQFQYFNTSELQTTAGEHLQIIFPGQLNTNQGPDFSNAQIRIDDTLLAGSVELHVKTSQWNEHGHSADRNYKNVILHVVFENKGVADSPIPVLELQPRISGLLLDRYTRLMNASSFIPCGHSISEINPLTWLSWKERLVAERMTRKATQVFELLEQNQFHWEESFWWLLAKNFGIKVNAEAFEAVARSLPLSLLAKHRNRVHQLEALLTGQAGLLKADFKDPYPKLLYREYCFLKNKYGLPTIHAPVQFMRMRPGNFPTLRLSQLAALIAGSDHLFSAVMETEKLAAVKKLFDVSVSDYWHDHYRFDEASAFKKKPVGQEMVVAIMINTIIPVLFAYGLHHKEEKYKNKAILWLDQLPAEINSITKGFCGLGLSNKTAFDSQAFIELKTQYCHPKHCLQCAVGNGILKTVHITDRAFL
jgi:hypothetical protein